VRNFVAIGSWVSILWGVKIRHLPLTWPVAVNTLQCWRYRAACDACFKCGSPPLPPLGHICDVMLVWRKENIEKILSLCYSIVYYYNGAQRCEQFLQVSRLYRILILLSLALYLPSASVSLVFMVLYIKKNLLTSFSLPFSELSLMDWPLTWLTNHCPSVQQLWHCWLDYLTCKIVSENNLQCFEWDVKPYYTHTLQMRHIQEI